VMRHAMLLLLGLAACRPAFAPPRSIQPSRMVLDLGARWAAAFPGSPRLGLLAPRFGAPVLVQRGRAFAIELAERGGPVGASAALLRTDLLQPDLAACVRGALPAGDCVPLQLRDAGRTAFAPGLAGRTLTATPRSVPGAGPWDLVLIPDASAPKDALVRQPPLGRGAPQRAPRAVFVFDDDPARPRRLRVAQLTDFHLGKAQHGDAVRRHLLRAIAEINALRPDLVLVTGDLVEQGRNPSLAEHAAGFLRTLAPPVVVIIGNHDYGHFPTMGAQREPDEGYFNFARALHPNRTLRFVLGGWTFYGFDSGPSVFSPRVLTRGIDQEALSAIGLVLDEARASRASGVVLFSHAPSHSVLSSRGQGDASLDNCCGHMVHGSAAFEERLRRAAAGGLRVLHLSGHTHWSDVFECVDAGCQRFERWPFDRLGTARAVRGNLALINAPSATFPGLPTLAHARRFGFVLLDLDGHEATVTYRYLDR
jgi:hypothetical protein